MSEETVYERGMQKILETHASQESSATRRGKLREAMRRGEAAKRLRNDEDLKKAFEVGGGCLPARLASVGRARP